MKQLKMAEAGIMISSLELTEMINNHRSIEGNRSELRHRSLVAKISKEVGILSSYGIATEANVFEDRILSGNNIMIKGYRMSREFALQMLSSESTLVRASVMEYIKHLEEEIQHLEDDVKSLDNIARGEVNLDERRYQADLVKYGWRNITKIIMESDYTTLEATVNEVINFHTNVLDKKDRATYKNHIDANGTEYKQMVRDRVYGILVDKQRKESSNVLITTVIYSLTDKLLKEKIKTTNRSNGRKISSLTNKLSKELTDIDFHKIDVHGMSANALYRGDKMTPAYFMWTKNFPYDQVPSKEEFEANGVDFNKPIEFTGKAIHKSGFDVDNLIKSFVDTLFNEARGKFGVDDNIVKKVSMESIGICDEYSEGKLYFNIANI